MPAENSIPYTEKKYRDGNFQNLTDEMLYRLLVAHVRPTRKPVSGDTIQNTTYALPLNAIWFSVAPASVDDEFDINWSPAKQSTGIKICYATPESIAIKPEVDGQPITITVRGIAVVSYLTELPQDNTSDSGSEEPNL
ncbi:hypothetical protein [Xanthocytophaga agilis]|uniref:Uncharacterized protein n=1 Tax=Xanthocytophaga agilis TaxID=3048010 RepID=A0AAE3RCE0_9BACT|nr:hypothetical protein [Xanthocytophaga agilis]MDJ1504998.1 hypothetical protein [Xanthocytophaga agilis]